MLKIEVSSKEFLSAISKVVSKKYKLRPKKFLENKITCSTDTSPEPFEKIIIETHGVSEND